MLSAVYAQVAVQSGPADEVLPTLLTLVRALDGVASVVPLSLLFTAEGLIALSTVKEPFCSVAQLVSSQV